MGLISVAFKGSHGETELFDFTDLSKASKQNSIWLRIQKSNNIEENKEDHFN